MDPVQFDRLSKAVFRAGTRRRLLGLLTTAPVLASLTVLLSPEAGRAEHPAQPGLLLADELRADRGSSHPDVSIRVSGHPELSN